MTIRIPWQLGDDPHAPFPPADTALEEPDGLLAIGGDLSSQRLLRAYAAGVFPWSSPGEPLLWWSPDPRGVIVPEELHIGRSLQKCLRRTPPLLKIIISKNIRFVFSV